MGLWAFYGLGMTQLDHLIGTWIWNSGLSIIFSKNLWCERNQKIFPKLMKRHKFWFDQIQMKRILSDFTQRLMHKRDEFQARLMKRSENENEEDFEETNSVQSPPKRYDYRLMKKSDKTGYGARLMKY